MVLLEIFVSVITSVLGIAVALAIASHHHANDVLSRQNDQKKSGPSQSVFSGRSLVETAVASAALFFYRKLTSKRTGSVDELPNNANKPLFPACQNSHVASPCSEPSSRPDAAIRKPCTSCCQSQAPSRYHTNDGFACANSSSASNVPPAVNACSICCICNDHAFTLENKIGNSSNQDLAAGTRRPECRLRKILDSIEELLISQKNCLTTKQPPHELMTSVSSRTAEERSQTEEQIRTALSRHESAVEELESQVMSLRLVSLSLEDFTRKLSMLEECLAKESEEARNMGSEDSTDIADTVEYCHVKSNERSSNPEDGDYTSSCGHHVGSRTEIIDGVKVRANPSKKFATTKFTCQASAARLDTDPVDCTGIKSKRIIPRHKWWTRFKVRRQIEHQQLMMALSTRSRRSPEQGDIARVSNV